MNEIYSIIMAVLGLLAAGGWSHGLLSSRITALEINKINEDEVRRIMDDKLEAHNVAFQALAEKVNELKDTMKELNKSIKDLNNNVQKGNS